MPFEVKILGSNSAIHAHGRHPTSQLLNIGQSTFLIDCGEGVQFQMSRYQVKPFKIECIFISHLHGDHYYGLIGLLTTFQLMGRTRSLTIVSPPELKEIIEVQLAASQTILRYDINFKSVIEEGYHLIYENKEVEVFTFPLDHKIPCSGFLFQEKESLRKINRQAIEGLRLSPENYTALRHGQDIYDRDNQFHHAEALTLAPPPPRRYAYCTDTLYKPSITPYIHGVDLLYHESTFMADLEERAQATFHSTTIQAAQIAQSAQVKQLMIGHYSSRYPHLEPLLKESQSVFSNTILAIEGESTFLFKEA